MSYTPDDQLLEEKLEKLIDTIDPLREAMMNRLRHPHEWREEHLQEIREWVNRLWALEVDALKLKSEVR